MYRSLVDASVKLHGVYNNGAGRNRFKPIHESVKARPLIEIDGVEYQESVGEFAGRLVVVSETIKTPSNELKDLVQSKHPKVRFAGRYGHEGLFLASREVIEANSLEDSFLADLAKSEINPEWAMTAEPKSIVDHAAVILGARAIAGHFHNLTLMKEGSI